MRDVETGIKTNERWRTSESVEKLVTEEIKSTFLFLTNEIITLMNNQTYEQFEVDVKILKEKVKLINDGMQLTCEIVDQQIVNILPNTWTNNKAEFLQLFNRVNAR